MPTVHRSRQRRHVQLALLTERNYRRWQPESLALPVVRRAYFAEARRDWLTMQQVADCLHVCGAGISRYYRSGYLPGSKASLRAGWFHRAFRRRLSGGCYILAGNRPTAAGGAQ